MKIRVLIGLLLLVSLADRASGQTHITSRTNIRLRAAPGIEAAIVANLPLGTELEIAGGARTGEWIPVQTTRGERGWIPEHMTLRISPATHSAIARQLIDARLQRKGDGFVARAELVAFVERTLARTPSLDERARLELQRFHAINAALAAIPFNRVAWDDRLRSWVAERSGQIRYNEPAGGWMISREEILDRQDKFASTAVSDELAWLAVQNGVAGECEGYLMCYLEWRDALEGEYLRRRPRGQHVDEAATRIKQVIDYYMGSSKPSDFFERPRECPALDKVITALEAALYGSAASARAELARGLRSMRALCQ